MKKNINWGKIINMFVLVTLIIATIYVIVSIIISPSEVSDSDPYGHVKADYVLMLLQCILGLFAFFLPSFLEHKLNIKIPSYMLVLYTVFLYAAIYLGEVRNFYYTVSNWDLIVHTFSGAMLGSLGYSVITLLNNTKRIPVNLSPIFVAVFTFSFALSLGALWEIYEFAVDGLFHQNMQKFALEDGTMLIGRSALADTMEDLIVDSLGAFVMSVVGYISLKFKKGWVEKLQIRKNHDKDKQIEA